MIASVTSTSACDRCRCASGRSRRLAVGQAVALGVVGVDVQRAAGRAAGPASAGCASTSCWSADGGGRRAPGRVAALADPAQRLAQAGDVGDERLGRQLDHARCGVRSASGRRGFSGPEVDAVRGGLERAEAEAAVGLGAEPVAVRAGAQHQVEQPLGPDAGRERRERSRPVSGRGAVTWACRSRGRSAHARHTLVERRHVGVRAQAGGDAGQAQQRHPLVGEGRVGRERRRRVVGDVADREQVEREVVVAAAQRRGRRAGSRRRGAWSR